MIKTVFSGYFCQKSDKVRSMSYMLFGKTQPGNNQAISRESAFNSANTQIKNYSAVSSGIDNI